MTTLLFFLLLLVCPLMMVFMMRGHGHGGHTEQAAHTVDPSTESLDELKRRRSALDAEISFREGR